MNFVICSILVFLLYNLWRAFRLFKNYLEARKYGITIVILPVSQEDIWWALSRGAFKWIKQLPDFLSYWYDFTTPDWSLIQRHEPHKKYGDPFVLVSPLRNEIIVNDPKACHEVHMRWKSWHKPSPIYEIVKIFGNNVFCDNGSNWQRQRRIMNPAFSEANNHLVWQESLSQSREMLKQRVERHGGYGTIDDMRQDFVLVALHVLAAAGFGHTHEYSGGLREVPAGHTKSLSASLLFILTHIIQMVLLTKTGLLNLPSWLLPKPIREIQVTMAEFRGYVRESIAYNRAITHGGGNSGLGADIVGTLIRADEAAKREEKKGTGNDISGKPMYLTDDELFGNLFIFNLAGFETTANSMSYTLPFLARHPEVQDWVGEEIDTVLKDLGDKDPEYKSTFPTLVRCLALMYETIRLWGPAPHTQRWASGEMDTLCVNGHDLVIPAGTFVTTNIYGAHSDPRWWGPDSEEWRPQRWVTVDADGQETIRQPLTRVPYLAWSIGPRACPGKKFSQVEFVAVISTILKTYRIKPWLMKGEMETMQQARDALLDIVKDSTLVVVPNMKRPQAAGIVLVPR